MCLKKSNLRTHFKKCGVLKKIHYFFIHLKIKAINLIIIQQSMSNFNFNKLTDLKWYGLSPSWFTNQLFKQSKKSCKCLSLHLLSDNFTSIKPGASSAGVADLVLKNSYASGLRTLKSFGSTSAVSTNTQYI